MKASNFQIQKLENTLQLQFPGLLTADVLKNITITISRKTGRIRGVFDEETGVQLFSLRTSDGRYLPTFTGATRIHETGYKGFRVVMMEEAVPFIAAGKSAFCKHISSADSLITPKSEVFLCDSDGELLAVGIAQQPAYAMMDLASGLAVRVKHSRDKST